MASEDKAVLCRDAGKGRVAASRASLSLLLVLPVDDRRRCLGPKLVPDTCNGWTTMSTDFDTDIGEALAAATERESRLRFERSLEFGELAGDGELESEVQDMIEFTRTNTSS